MKRFWQTEWQGIQFADVTDVSSTKLADSAFYNNFYRALFEKYTGYDDLDLDWRQNKEEIAEWITSRALDGSRVLSVGCGLGYIEQYLYSRHSDSIELHVSDYASNALRWLKEVLPAASDRIHNAAERRGQIDDFSYDLIYLSAVDYALDDQYLIEMLTHYRDKLTDTGQVILISASFLDGSGKQTIAGLGKDILKAVLDKLRLRSRGQFWGWLRTRSEYQRIIVEAGFSSTEDGFIETDRQRTFWISGKLGASS